MLSRPLIRDGLEDMAFRQASRLLDAPIVLKVIPVDQGPFLLVFSWICVASEDQRGGFCTQACW